MVWILTFFFFFCRYFFLLSLSFHSHTCGLGKFPRLGAESEPRLWHAPQPQQHWIQTASLTYATACTNTGSLTPWARSGIEPISSQILYWVLNLLSHNRNSCAYFLNYSWFTMLCQFPLYSKVAQNYIHTHTHILFLILSFHHFILRLDIVSCATKSSINFFFLILFSYLCY